MSPTRMTRNAPTPRRNGAKISCTIYRSAILVRMRTVPASIASVRTWGVSSPAYYNAPGPHSVSRPVEARIPDALDGALRATIFGDLRRGGRLDKQVNDGPNAHLPRRTGVP